MDLRGSSSGGFGWMRFALAFIPVCMAVILDAAPGEGAEAVTSSC
jgi:hypothetical protein